MASRQLQCLIEVEECVSVSPMDYDQAASLISRISGEEEYPYLLRSLPVPLKEAVVRPLFAILYANY